MINSISKAVHYVRIHMGTRRTPWTRDHPEPFSHRTDEDHRDPGPKLIPDLTAGPAQSPKQAQ